MTRDEQAEGAVGEPGRSPAILVVEDQAVVVLHLQRQLTRLGYRVLPPVATGEEAVAVCAQQRPDLVLMDIFLAGSMDGIEAATIIGKEQHVPVVFLSANSEPLTRRRAREAAPYGYVLKPFGERELAVTLELALAKHAVESRLIEQERWLSTTLACLGEAVIATDRDCRVRLVNAAAEALLGTSSDVARGAPLDAVVPLPTPLASPDGPTIDQLNALFERGVWVGGGERLVRGQARVLTDDRGTPQGLVLALRDETRRHRAEEQLRHMATALAAAGESVFITDTDGTIVYVNPAFCRLHGYAAEDVIGETPRLLKSGRHGIDHYASMWAALRAERAWRGEVWNQNKDGSQVFVRETIAPVFDLDGGVTHFVAIEHDLTQEQETSLALRESEERFRRAQRLEAVGRLAGSVAHDFNNVLTVVKGYSEFALRRQPSEPLRDALDQIHDASLRGIALTRRLLAFSKRREGAPRLLDPNETIRNALPFLRRLAGERVHLASALEEGAPAVRMDPIQFEQMLLNLVVNARDAMPGGGRLSIETERATRRPSGSEGEGGESWAIRVTDTGTGIAPEIQGRIFDAFFTTKSDEDGSGLGLATVREVVEAAGGAIELQSEPGRGTVFSVFLPPAAASDSEPERRPQPAAAAVVRGGTETILVVEDQEWVLLVARRLLESIGYAVIPAQTAAEALERFSAAVDLAVIDVVLRELDGPELATALRRRKPALPVLFVSGHDASTPDLAPDDRLTGFLPKPFGTETLAAAVRALLNRGQLAQRG